jgi:hypothetical protein
LANTGIDPGIVVSRPGYATALFILKRLFADSIFLWQSAAALLLLLAAFSIYSLVFALLRQFGYDYTDCRYGSSIAAAVYLIAPWSIVMSAWPTCSLTLLSQIFISIGLARLIASGPGHSYWGIIFLIVGFSIYEAYWLLFVPVAILLWLSNVWSFRQCTIFSSIVSGILLFLILFKFGASTVWEVPATAKTFNTDFITLFFNNIRGYPIFIADALDPVPVNIFFGSVFLVLILSLALGGISFNKVIALIVFLLSGLLSSAFFYAVVGYGLAGKGLMSRTLAAQNVYFALFIGILMISPVVRWRAWGKADYKGSRLLKPIRNIALLSTFCAFIVLIVSLGVGMVNRSLEWYALWVDELSSLKQFPINQLRAEIRRLQGSQKTVVIVQIDKDNDGRIFGGHYEIAPALIFQYPDLLIQKQNHNLEFIVGREAEFSTLWNGAQIIQKNCRTSTSLTVEATHVIYIKIGTDGSSHYDSFPLNVERGCRHL